MGSGFGISKTELSFLSKSKEDVTHSLAPHHIVLAFTLLPCGSSLGSRN